jgi:uncharacterized protein YjbI with pentapeptide repeats
MFVAKSIHPIAIHYLSSRVGSSERTTNLTSIGIMSMLYLWIIVTIIISVLLSVCIVIGLLGPITNRIVRREEGLTSDRRVEVRIATRDTLLKAAGGFVLLLGAAGTVGTLAYTAQTARASQNEAVAAQNEVSITSYGQVTNSYATAIDQLASGSRDERLGGIYALEGVMRESHIDQPAVINVLCDFVREHSTSGNLNVDILSALVVIARRDPNWDSNPIDLDGTHLDNAELNGAHFADANLSGAFMGGIQLASANLRGADLGSADISGADLNSAILQGANLNGDASLSGSTLLKADLRRVDLQNADLSGANLSGANLSGANLAGTNLSAANLEGADLLDVHGLTKRQISGAKLNSQTRLPAGL